MSSSLEREFIYLWYFLSIQIEQIAPYWLLGIVGGSLISVFGKHYIHSLLGKMQIATLGLWGVIPAALLGIASPLCMYGTIPLASSLYKRGLREDWLAAFMMSSVLLNPQLIIYSAALGAKIFWLRLIICLLCGILAGVLINICSKHVKFFDFQAFAEPIDRDTDTRVLFRLGKNILRNIRATGGYFLLGILLAALYQRYVPTNSLANLFVGSKALGILFAAGIGVPLYMCGGGTIPLLAHWLSSGMTSGAAAAFMISGPATKITNLSALKNVLGMKSFVIYITYCLLFAVFSGLLINILAI